MTNSQSGTIVSYSPDSLNPGSYTKGYIFRVCAIGPSGSYELPIGVSPETAARRDPAAFLQFADEVAAVAAKLRKPRQLRLSEAA